MNGLTRFVLEIGWVAKTVLIILLILSVLSWGIIIEKIRQFWKVGKESNKFLHLFKTGIGWTELYSYSRPLRNSPFSRVFRKSYNEFNKPSPYPQEEKSALQISVQNKVGMNHRTHYKDMVEAAVAEEMETLAKHLIFLSTTVSVSPFLGLFGTVWGVMQAFMRMGVKGSADISAVGPGIAEALITTVAGLAVAIPALFAYNFFVHKLNKFEIKLEVFSTELMRMMNGYRML